MDKQKALIMHFPSRHCLLQAVTNSLARCKEALYQLNKREFRDNSILMYSVSQECEYIVA